MADPTENMVLRTIYLPKELDQQLKAAAIRGDRSKGDVIRELIAAGMKTLGDDKTSYFAPSIPVRTHAVRPTAVKPRLVSKHVKKKARTLSKA
jgi:predicted DNA-binding protein